MNRPLRLEFSGVIYFITSSGNRRNLIYLQIIDFEFLGFSAMFASTMTAV